MKIIIYRWKAWNQADIEEAFVHLGYEVVPLAAQPDSIEEDLSYTEKTAALIQHERPWFLFSINYFPVLAEVGHETGIPYVSWNCDGSLLAMYHDSVFYETNRIFSFDRACVTRFRSLGVSRIWHLPLGVNARRLTRYFSHAGRAAVKDLDISFVGNLYQNNSYDQIVPQLPDYLAGYLDCCLEAQLAVSGGNILEVLLTPSVCDHLEQITDYQRGRHSFAGIRELYASTVLGFKAAQLARERSIQKLALAARSWDRPARLHLFTSDSADGLLASVHPPVDHLTQMLDIFRDSAINLNFTVPTIQTGIPLRVWDILGCGGFLLTDFQQELTDYFEDERHLAICEDLEELPARAQFYLSHEHLRKKAATSARELVLAEHTWDIRIREMIRYV